MLHTFIRWALSFHGVMHIIESMANIYEEAYISAFISLFTAMIMFGGAYIDKQHHKSRH